MSQHSHIEIIRKMMAEIPALRPSYCEDPASFEPHPWVLEAMQRAVEQSQQWKAWSNTLRVMREVLPEFRTSEYREGLNAIEAMEKAIRQLAASPKTLVSPLDDGQIRDLVNRLRQVAVSYGRTQQLRSRLSSAVIEALRPADESTKA